MRARIGFRRDKAHEVTPDRHGRVRGPMLRSGATKRTRPLLIAMLESNRLLLALATTLFVACGNVNPNHLTDGAGQCVAETDAVFCTRLQATCDSVSAVDNCGDMRTASCGMCGAGSACVANACKAPVCANLGFPDRSAAARRR